MSTRVASLAAAAAGLVTTADAHSWVHCSDYRGDTRYYDDTKCFGHPRAQGSQLPAKTAFGVDIGFNEQPEEVVDGISRCHSWQTAYSSQYPAARYRQGQTVTLAWPSKNHVAATCTNPYIPDTALELFIAPFDPHPTSYTQVKASFSDLPHENKKIDFQGFQNCPAFCENMDKSLCTGTFVVPDDLPDGRYTFQWKWEFNEGTAPYVTCFDAYVGQDVPVVEWTQQPTVEGFSPEPTPGPTFDPNADCVAEWGQCGGGQVQPACCVTGTTCQKQSPHYWQCRKDCPSGWQCDPNAGKTADPTAEPSPAPTAEPQTTCAADYGVRAQVKKAKEAAAVSATLESGCDCAKFCTVFAPGAEQFVWKESGGKCACYGKAGKVKTNGNNLSSVAGDLPLSNYGASFGVSI